MAYVYPNMHKHLHNNSSPQTPKFERKIKSIKLLKMWHNNRDPCNGNNYFNLTFAQIIQNDE